MEKIDNNKYVQEIDGKKIYFKKDIFGYRIINPNRDENGKLILQNFLFGGYRNLFMLLLLLLLFLSTYYMYNQQVKVYKEFYENFTINRIKFCNDFSIKYVDVRYNFNVSGLNDLNITT